MKNPLEIAAYALGILTFCSCSPDEEGPRQSPMDILPSLKTFGEPTAFSDGYSLADLRMENARIVESGPVAYAIGYRQVTDNDRDPILAKFVSDSLVWERNDYDTTDGDCTGYGLLWDGGPNLYAVFSTSGHTSSTTDGFGRFTENGWLSTYGAGGGATVAVIAKVNVETGEIAHATYARSQLADGSTNDLEVKDMDLLNNSYLQLHAHCGLHPLLPSGQPMNCSLEPPFSYRVVLSPLLELAERAEAEGCQ